MFRVGQKVVCVDDDFVTRNQRSSLPPCLPVKGSIYTIREFLSARAGKTFVRLIEIVNPLQGFINDGGPLEAAFAADRFRPLVSRKTDISIFEALLTPAGQKEPANG